MAHLYILKSLINNRYYIGSTGNLGRRIKEHNDGKSTYTKLTRPFKLVFQKKFSNISLAKNYEFKLKRFKNKKIIDRIVTEQTLKMVA